MQLFKLVSQGGYTEKPNTRGIDTDSKKTSAKNSLESPTEFGYKCVCLNARSIVNKRNELNIMVEDIDPHIIGITESWATPDISDAELGMTGYVMFRKDRLGRRGGGVMLYIKESIQAYEIKLVKSSLTYHSDISFPLGVCSVRGVVVADSDATRPGCRYRLIYSLISFGLWIW